MRGCETGTSNHLIHRLRSRKKGIIHQRLFFSQLNVRRLVRLLLLSKPTPKCRVELRPQFVEHITRRPPLPAFMALYLNRIIGPEKALISEEDLEDAPDEVIEWLRRLN